MLSAAPDLGPDLLASGGGLGGGGGGDTGESSCSSVESAGATTATPTNLIAGLANSAGMGPNPNNNPGLRPTIMGKSASEEDSHGCD